MSSYLDPFCLILFNYYFFEYAYHVNIILI